MSSSPTTAALRRYVGHQEVSLSNKLPTFNQAHKGIHLRLESQGSITTCKAGGYSVRNEDSRDSYYGYSSIPKRGGGILVGIAQKELTLSKNLKSPSEHSKKVLTCTFYLLFIYNFCCL